MRVDEAACNQQQETVVRLITENKVKIMPILSAFKILIDSLISNTSNQGLRELLEISQRSLSTPVQRARRPAPTIHKEVTCVLRGYSMNSGFTQGPGVGYNIVKLEQVQTEAVADEIEVVTLPRPGAARIAIVKSLPAAEPSEQENDTGAATGFPQQGKNDPIFRSHIC